MVTGWCKLCFNCIILLKMLLLLFFSFFNHLKSFSLTCFKNRLKLLVLLTRRWIENVCFAGHLVGFGRDVHHIMSLLHDNVWENPEWAVKCALRSIGRLMGTQWKCNATGTFLLLSFVLLFF